MKVEKVVEVILVEFFIVEGSEEHWVEHLIVTLVINVTPLDLQLHFLTLG